MTIAIEKLPYELNLGRQTENGVTIIEVNVQPWLDKWPGMKTEIMVTRPGESVAYPAATRIDGDCIIWTVNGTDTAVAGRGTAEILGLVNGVRKLSRTLRTRITASTVAETGDPPESAQPWVDTVINAADEIKNMTATAETLQPGEAATASYSDGKLSLGIPKGDKGDPGAKGDRGPQGDPGSDANVTADNIQSALGYAPVKDVQVAGSSVLDSGVANVPVASSSVFGVVKTQSWGGTMMDDNGYLVVYPSTNDHITRRISKTVIAPTNLDYAVKAAMCDGKGAAWTADEQDAARERIGVDKPFELIEKIVIQEETASISRELSLEALYLEIVTSDLAEADSKAQYVTVGIDGIQYSVYLGQTVKVGQVRYAKLLAERKHGRYIITAYQPGNLTQALTMHFQHNAVGIVGDKITKIRIHEAQMPAGTEIAIYGVRA